MSFRERIPAGVEGRVAAVLDLPAAVQAVQHEPHLRVGPFPVRRDCSDEHANTHTHINEQPREKVRLRK